MRVIYDIVGSFAIAVAGLAVFRNVRALTRATNMQTRNSAVRRVIADPAGYPIRFSLGLMAAGISLIANQWLDSAGQWLVAACVVAILIWDRSVWVKSLRGRRGALRVRGNCDDT